MNHPLEQNLYNPTTDGAASSSNNLGHHQTSTDTRINNVNRANSTPHPHQSINIDVHTTSAFSDSPTSTPSSTTNSIATTTASGSVQQNFLSFLNEARNHFNGGGSGIRRPTTLNLQPATSTANVNTAVHSHHNHHLESGVGGVNGIDVPQAQATEDSSVNRWRVNLNNVLSLSGGPSTETIRSWIPRTGTFRYVPLNRSSSLNSSRDRDQITSLASGARGEAAATNDVIINFSTMSPSSGTSGVSIERDRDIHSTLNREPRSAPILTRISVPRSNSINGETAGEPTSPSTPSPHIGHHHHRGTSGATPPTTPPPSVSSPQQQRNPLETDEDNVVYELVVKVLNHFLRYLPFIGIVLLKAIYDHWLGIIDILVLHTVVYQVNKSLVEQVAKMSQKSLGLLFRDYLLLTFVLVYRFMMAYNQPDYFGLILNTVIDPKSLGQLLYAVAVNDLMMKLITIKIKILVTSLPTDVIKHKSRGRLFALIEAISQLYRSLVPVKSWMLYLLVSYTGFDIIVGMFFFSSLYMGAKAFEFVERGKFLKKAFCSFLRNVDYGRQPSKEELSEAGATCPICHDNYDTPVVLECNHIFCEVCVGTWFKREQTCPMCRAKVADDPTWQNGSTTMFYQLC